MVASSNAVAVRPNSPVSANMQPETACRLRAIVNAISKGPALSAHSCALAVNTRDQGRPIAYIELLKNMIQMSPDGPIADPEIMGDGAVRRAAGDKRDDLVFPARELRKAVACCCAGPIAGSWSRTAGWFKCEQRTSRDQPGRRRSAPEAKSPNLLPS
jgi:hypothetical protein